MSNNIIRSLSLVSLATLLLAACSDDITDASKDRLAPLMPLGFGNIVAHENVPTRSSFDVGGTTFYPYDELYPVPINPDFSTIGAFMAQNAGAGAGAKDTYNNIAGYFRYQGDNKWETTVGVKPEDYFIFGYMPSNAVNGVVINKRTASTSWADGCVMTFHDLSTVTPADVCVVVGVLKGNAIHTDPSDPSSPIEPLPGIDNDPTNVSGTHLTQGVYAYQGTEQDNYVYLLLDHLYANVNLELAVEPQYAELRTIVLRQVKMKAKSVTDKIDIDVTLGNSPTKPIERIAFPDDFTSTDNVDAQIYPLTSDNGLIISSDLLHPTSVPSYFAPGMTTQAFEFEFRYDVYDKAHPDDPTNYPYGGNRVREGCIAVNKWSLSGQQVEAGKSFKVTATIRPTYLYQLSDPDLDNPTVVLDVNP